MPTKKKFYCHRCGAELSSINCRKSNNGVSGYSYLCLDCEESRLQEITELQGIYEALYGQCSALDVPLVPRVLDGVDLTTLDKPWIAYLRLLKDNGEYLVDGQLRGFKDGVKSIFGVFGNNLTHTDFTARIKQDVAKIQAERKRKQAEEERIAKLPGTEEQRERWGELPIYKGLPLTDALYQELDRQYEIRAAEFRGQTISPQMDDTLIKVAKANVVYDYLIRQGLVKPALDMQKGIDLLLASEEMRKKDAKKQENFRIDSQIVALEKAGLYEDGKFLSYEETCKKLIEFARRKGKYPITIDMVDNMVMDYYNVLRRNNDQQTANELTEDMATVDDFGECVTEPSADEIERKRFAGVTKVPIIKKNEP